MMNNTGNQAGSFTMPPSGKIILPFMPEAAIASLPSYCASEGVASLMDTLIEYLADGSYQFVSRACPSTNQQGTSNVILANQTFEDQISVPAGSFLTMVCAIGLIQSNTSDPANPYNTVSTNFRMHLYDAGAQSEVVKGWVNGRNIAGHMNFNNNVLKQSGGQFQSTGTQQAKGPFILPSPLSITSPGQLNVKFTNLLTQSISIEGAFFFAVPMQPNSVIAARIGNSVGR